MEKNVVKKKNKNGQKEPQPAERIIKLIFRGLIPIVLLAGGLFLLDLRLLGWSLVFGLPMTVAGAALLIFTYDEIAGKKITVTQPKIIIFESRLLKCHVCGKKTPRAPGEREEDIICPKCKSDIARKIQKEEASGRS